MKTLIKVSYFILWVAAIIAYLLLGSYLISTVFATSFTVFQFIMLHMLVGISVTVYKLFFRY